MTRSRINFLADRLFLLRSDFLRSLKEERKRLCFYGVFLLAGVILGVFIGIKIGEKESPFGIFALLFHMDFAPFGHLLPDFLRFLFFAVFAGLSYFLPCPKLYPLLSMIFFGKYFGQFACLAFLSDSLIAAFFSLFLVYLPLLVVGGFLLFSIAIYGEDSRLCRGADVCHRSLKRFFHRILLSIVCYFSLLFILYVLLCGTLYLIVISL